MVLAINPKSVTMRGIVRVLALLVRQRYAI
jgi:hypothetical protein